MPPRKLRKQGGKKDLKHPDESEKLTELDKTILMGQIKSLEEKLKYSQTKWREAEVNCETYKLNLEQVTQDKQNIVAFLRQNLDQRGDEIAELQERLHGLQKAREDDIQAHKQQIQVLKSQYQEMKDQLTSENIVLSGKLTSLEEFKSQKEEILAKMDTLQAKLKKQDEDHRETVRNIERRNILEKDKLKKEIKQNLEDVAFKFRQISNQHMSETTRRAIQENAALSFEMEKMADRLSKVQSANQTLTEVNRQQKLRITTMEGIEAELVKRNCFLSKTAKDNEEKLKAHSAAVIEFQMARNKCSQMEQEVSKLQNEVKFWKEEATMKKQMVESTQENLNTTTNKFKTVEIHNKTLEDIIINATNALEEGLYTKESSFADAHSMKESILNHVLAVLNEGKKICNTVKSPLKGRQCRDILGKETPIKLTQKSKREVRSSEAGYLAGDIGLIPRPNLTPSLLALVHLQKRNGIDAATQTERLSEIKLPHSSLSSMRMVKSAAYRVLHETNCSSNYVDSFKYLPRNSNV